MHDKLRCFFDSRVTKYSCLWRHTPATGPSPGFSNRGAKIQKEGPKTRRGATFLKYSIGCMQQQGSQTRNGRAPISNGGPGTTAPPLATALTSSYSDPAWNLERPLSCWWKIHFETKKYSQKLEDWSFVHFSVRWNWIILPSADCFLSQ